MIGSFISTIFLPTHSQVGGNVKNKCQKKTCNTRYLLVVTDRATGLAVAGLSMLRLEISFCTGCVDKVGRICSSDVVGGDVVICHLLGKGGAEFQGMSMDNGRLVLPHPSSLISPILLVVNKSCGCRWHLPIRAC